MTIQELYTAISRLPDKQAKRIYAHFILGLTKQDIARAEGVDEKVVRLAIERGLRNLEKIFIRCTDFASKMKWLMRGSQSLGPHWPEAGHASRRLKTE